MTPGFSESEYRQLVQAFPPRPVRDEDTLAQTEARIDRLLSLDERTPTEDEYLDLLSTLVGQWEAANVEIEPISGVEMIRFLLEQRGLPDRALTPIFRATSIVSDVLSGKRTLRTQHIQQLAEFFAVSPAVFFPVRLHVQQSAA